MRNLLENKCKVDDTRSNLAGRDKEAGTIDNSSGKQQENENDIVLLVQDNTSLDPKTIKHIHRIENSNSGELFS